MTKRSPECCMAKHGAAMRVSPTPIVTPQGMHSVKLTM